MRVRDRNNGGAGRVDGGESQRAARQAAAEAARQARAAAAEKANAPAAREIAGRRNSSFEMPAVRLPQRHDTAESSFDGSARRAEVAAQAMRSAEAEPLEAEQPASETAETPAEKTPASELDEADIAKLGTAVPPDGGKQAIWGETAQSLVCGRAREQGLLPPEADNKANDFANKMIPTGEKKQFSAGDLVGMAKQMGLPLEKLSETQIAQATRFVNEAPDVQNQRGRIAMAMNNLGFIANDAQPKLQKSDVAFLAEKEARIPNKAFKDVKGSPDAEFQKIAGALNTPGESKLKVGKYNVTTNVSAEGALQSTKAKKPGLFSKIGGFIKKVAPMVLKVASFIPGPIGIAARVVNGVVGAVKAIKSGSVLGAIGAVAGAVAGGAGAIAGKATAGVAATVAKVAGTVAKVAGNVQAGITAWKTKNPVGFLSAVAGAAGNVAGAIGNGASGLSKTLTGVAKWANRGATGVSAIDQARKGNVLGALSTGAALAGDIAGKDSKLGKDLATMGRAAGTAQAVKTGIQTGDYAGVATSLTNFAASVTNDPKLKLQLETASKTITGVDNTVTAIKNKDWMGAISSGAAVADGLSKNKDVEGFAKVSGGVTGLRNAVKSGDPDAIAFAAKGLFDATKEAGKGVYERHLKKPLDEAASNEIAQLPVGRNFGQLLGAVPGVPAAPAKPGQAPILFNGPAATNAAAGPAAVRPTYTFSADLKIGQTLLNQKLGTSLTPDGLLGPKTREAIEKFQRMTPGLKVTGRYDAPTQAALETGSASVTVSPTSDGASDQLRARTQNLNLRAGEAITALYEQINDSGFGSAAVKLYSGQLSKMQAAAKEIGERKRDLDLMSANPRTPAQTLRNYQNNLEAAILKGYDALGKNGETLGRAQTVAEAVKFGADITIKTLGKAYPGLQTAYAALASGGGKFAETGNLRQSLLTAAGAAGGAVVGQKLGGMELSALGSVAGEIAKELPKSAAKILAKIDLIKASSPEDWRRQVGEVVASEARSIAASVVYATATKPLGNIKPDSPAGKLIKAALEKQAEKLLKDGFLEPLIQAPFK